MPLETAKYIAGMMLTPLEMQLVGEIFSEMTSNGVDKVCKV